ncbi:helix-turn-helix domain-containing protein [Agrobacterium rosae]|uniref:DNA binding domain, excisionase family n=1 Tax=Agrobacterium rosae TaxID=1972867 RepID=A0A1R3TSD5_9HYPH|nr:helix-turn-helix domain-containing protein [Agrobacterium rosae]SCX27238.1 DNA binding domain, excisionase family [Agrobacterium rosae]
MINRPLPKEPMFTAAEAAAKLGISVKTLMRHVEDGRIRYVNVGTEKRKQYRFTDYMLEQFITNNKRREKKPCPSTSPKAPPITVASSNSTVIAFTSLQKPLPKKKQS